MGWILITIVLPIIAPAIGILVFLPAKQFLPNGVPNVIMLVKDAQLGWAALGFCTSALYEIFVPSAGMKMSAGQDYYWAIGGAMLLIFFSGVIAATGIVFPTPPRPANVPFRKHYVIFLSSLLLTVLAALLYAMVHYGIFGMQTV